jgi:hypothetical protein
MKSGIFEFSQFHMKSSSTHTHEGAVNKSGFACFLDSIRIIKLFSVSKIHAFSLFVCAFLLCSCWGCGKIIRSQHFTIKNNSSATEPLIHRFAETLEKSRTDVGNFLRKDPPNSIYVFVEEGSGQAHAYHSGQLCFYYSDGKIYSAPAAHEITHLTADKHFINSLRFMEEGLAEYVEESLDPAAISSQSNDAWVKLFIKKETVLPLWKIFDIRSTAFTNPWGSNHETVIWQTYQEAGSFVRFLIDSRGWDAFWDFYNSGNSRSGLGIPLQNLEREWLETLHHKSISYSPCRKVLDQSIPWYRMVCDQVDP